MRPLLCLLLALAACRGAVAADEAAALPFVAAEKPLGGGALAIAVPVPGSGVVVGCVVVRTGLRDDADGAAGAAQVVAQLVARGTAARATAGDDATVFTLTSAVPSFGAALDALGARIAAPAWDERAARLEAMLAARAARATADDPPRAALDALRRAAFTRHPYGRPALGIADDLDRLADAPAALTAFHRRRYASAATVVVLAGDASADALLALADHAFGAWRVSGDASAPPAEPEAPPRPVTVEAPEAMPPALAIGWRVAPASAADHAALALLAEVLGATYVPHRDPYLLVATARLGEIADAPGARAMIEGRAGLTLAPAAFEAARGRLLGALARAGAAPHEAARLVASWAAAGGGLAAYARALAALTPADASAGAARLLRPDTMATGLAAHGGAPAPPAARGTVR